MRRGSFALILGVAAGCQAPPSDGVAPAPRVLAEDVAVWALAADGTHVYYTAGLGGEASREGRVMRVARADGAPEVLAAEQFNPTSLALGADTVYWSEYGDFVSCGRIHARPKGGGAARDITPPAAGPPFTCHFELLAEEDGRLLALSKDEEDGGIVLLRLETASAAPAELVARLDGGYVSASAIQWAAYYFMVSDPVGSWIVRVDRETAWPGVVASGVRRPEGLAVSGSHVYWIDAELPGDAPRLYGQPMTGWDGTTRLELSADLAATALLLDGGDLWIPAETDSLEHRGVLLRVPVGGDRVERFTLAYEPRWVADAGGGDLLVRTEPDQRTATSRILLQPKP